MLGCGDTFITGDAETDDWHLWIVVSAPSEGEVVTDLPPFFAHEIIRHFPTPGLRLRTAEPAKRSRTQPAPAM